jgi:hypothetical protein
MLASLNENVREMGIQGFPKLYGAYMKHPLTRFILAAGLSALFGSLVLSAQGLQAKANIPFAFQTSERTLSAGEYTVQRTSPSGILKLSDYAGHATFMLSRLTDTSAQANPRLVFRVYGNERVLSQVWMDDGSGYSVPESATEKNLHHQLKITPTLVSLPLHR